MIKIPRKVLPWVSSNNRRLNRDTWLNKLYRVENKGGGERYSGIEVRNIDGKVRLFHQWDIMTVLVHRNTFPRAHRRGIKAPLQKPRSHAGPCTLTRKQGRQWYTWLFWGVSSIARGPIASVQCELYFDFCKFIKKRKKKNNKYILVS